MECRSTYIILLFIQNEPLLLHTLAALDLLINNNIPTSHSILCKVLYYQALTARAVQLHRCYNWGIEG